MCIPKITGYFSIFTDMFQSSGNFIFIPDKGNALSGKLYELGEANGYRKNALVIIPYQNPQVKAPRSFFFEIKNIREVQNVEPVLNPNKINIELKARTPKETYLKKISGLKEHIQQGNIYEINYCMEFYASEITLNVPEVFANLYHLTKAPYSALVKIGDEFTICGSPELFLKKENDLLFTKPIKGTIKRGATPEEDEALKNNLYHSLKERTENVMAVDVARNDLSHFATKGSVEVNKLYNIETFETVHQMVSTVSCKIKPGTSFEEIIEATFPMASMTGAPKLRAMQLIDEFEDFERKNYSGTMGIIDENGDFTLSVIIRSVFYNQQSKQLSIAVGGAITYLSEPEKEYEECLLKAKAMLRALDAGLL
ncbi:MAG: anthranilate synthase component I family protein [Bacteroidia bacterium]|nr:anthranilate synthase component I family protein [Bacteroidia bacterium]